MADPGDPNTPIDPVDPSTETPGVETPAAEGPGVGNPGVETPATETPEPPATPQPDPAAPPLPPYAASQHPNPTVSAPGYPASGYPGSGYPGAPTYPGAQTYPGAATYPGATTYPGAGVYPGAPPQQDAPHLVQPYPGAPPTPYGGGPVPPGVAGRPSGERPKTLGIVALVLAIIGAVMAFVPFVTWFSGLFLLPAFIIAIVVLVKASQGGKGLGIAALIISVVAWIVSVVVTITSFALIADAASDPGVDEPGFSVTDPPNPQDDPSVGLAEDPIVVESAFGRTSYDPATWWYAVVIENPNPDHVFDAATIDIQALGSDGTVRDTSTEYPTLLNGRTALAGIFTAVGDGEIAELDIQAPDASEALASPFDETGAFVIDAISATSDGYSTTVTGNVSGSFDSEQEFVAVVVVARGADGEIAGAEFAYVDLLPSDGTAVAFEAVFFGELPQGTTFEAYASL